MSRSRMLAHAQYTSCLQAGGRSVKSAFEATECTAVFRGLSSIMRLRCNVGRRDGQFFLTGWEVESRRTKVVRDARVAYRLHHCVCGGSPPCLGGSERLAALRWSAAR